MKSSWNIYKWTEYRDLNDPRIVRRTVEYGVVKSNESEENADAYLMSLTRMAEKKGWTYHADIGQHSISVRYMNNEHVIMYFTAKKELGFGKIPFHPSTH